MPCRPFRGLFLALVHLTSFGVLAGAGAACGNIGLEASADGNAAPTGPLSPSDASAGDAYSYAPSTEGDAGAGVVARTNALCHWSPGEDAGSVCYPDERSSCSAPRLDAGAVEDAAPPPDAATVADAGGALGCHLVSRGGSVGQACTAAGSGGDGTPCQASHDCAPAFECVGSPGRCRAYCCDGNASCGDASFCDIQTTSGASDPNHFDLKVPACTPVSACKLLAPNACNAGETCAIVKDDGTPSCVAVGPATDGMECDDVHCAEGLTCLGKPGGRQCYRLCRLGTPSDCAAGLKCKGSAQLFTDPSIGICQ